MTECDNEPYTIMSTDGYGNPIPLELLRGRQSLRDFLNANATPIPQDIVSHNCRKPRRKIERVKA